MHYELVIELKYSFPDAKKYNISVPVVLHAKPDLMQFSSKRVYLNEPDKESLKYPDLELPKPLFQDFKPVKRDTVQIRENPE